MPTVDDFIPEPRLREINSQAVSAPAAAAFELAKHFDLARSPLVHALFWLRTIPERWSGHAVEAPDLHVDAIGREGTGFRVLSESPNRLIVGAVGRFWTPDITFADVAPADFATYQEPGWGKVAWELRCDTDGSGSRLVFELRVTATDDDSWRKLRRYFRLIGPFSRFIRRHELSLIARELGAPETAAQSRTLEGDEIIARPKASVTDSIVIDAEPSAVWPWLMQMGRGRAGWYSYDRLDNGGVSSATEIIPELQQVAVGDVWPAAADGVAGFTVLQLAAPHALVLGALIDTELDRAVAIDAIKPRAFWQVTWAFQLEPLQGGRTQLWARARVDYSPNTRLHRLTLRAQGLIHHFMEQEQLRNLKLRAEGKATRAPVALHDVVEGGVGVASMLASLATPFRRDARSHWGMSQEDAERSYPGDALIATPLWQWSHAVEVDAQPAAVWPWIAQLGQDKAGFYSYQLLENIAGCEIHNADRIHPEWQAPRVGDTLRLHPEMPALDVREVVPQHHLLVAAGLDPETGTAPIGRADGRTFVSVSWLFMVEPRPHGRARVISRYRCSCSEDFKTRIMYGPLVTEAIGFAMDRRMLLGIRERVERPRPYAPPAELS